MAVPGGILCRRRADSVEEPSQATGVARHFVSLLVRVGLRTNVFKAKTGLCIPGRIRTCQSQAPYIEQTEGHEEVGIWKNPPRGVGRLRRGPRGTLAAIAPRDLARDL